MLYSRYYKNYYPASAEEKKTMGSPPEVMGSPPEVIIDIPIKMEKVKSKATTKKKKVNKEV